MNSSQLGGIVNEGSEHGVCKIGRLDIRGMRAEQDRAVGILIGDSVCTCKINVELKPLCPAC